MEEKGCGNIFKILNFDTLADSCVVKQHDHLESLPYRRRQTGGN